MSAQSHSLLTAEQVLKTAYDDVSGTLKVSDPRMWASNHVPATATVATISKAAGAAGVKHVCTGVIASIACGATAQTPLIVRLRDGATGAGTVLAAWSISAPANSSSVLALTGLCIPGTAATAMTLEFSAAGEAATQQCVTLLGYDI